ncbi:DUF1853 family protein [Caballeronia humi]|uniref:DUF1853 family protein n=1 Tax=Caballeronia humi TaxID=326474 RepID=A0A158IB76_9BURK|nr:DUF1853 family protein [Caballeronia humi]SAL53529.1 hypothetical protein AWB65_04486 [Caballeronia humi]
MDAERLVDAYGDVTVRDLAWLLFAPDLLRASHAGAPLAHPFETPSERDATLDWLAVLDRDPATLHERARNPKLTRLGFYAESLLEYFLTHGPAASLVAANVPLRRQRVTIGEFDFLLQTARGARLHWELAVKFYLHIGDGSAATARLSDYVGPNLQDRFDLKHERLLTHQLALTSRAEFASLGFEGPWEPQLYIKGRLFYHGESVTPAPELGDAHLRGWWRTVSEWGAMHAESDDAWVVQPRLAWLASRRLAASDGDALLAHAATIRERLSGTVSPTMVAAYGRNEKGEFVERSRGFIVPDDWPERAREFALTTI